MSDQSLVTILRSLSIIDKIRNDYPETARLIQYNPEGTVKLLKAKKVLFTYRSTQSINVDHKGYDNIKAWQDYKVAIDKFLYNLNGQEELQLARDTLSKHIHDKHYERFPLWPSVGDTQTSTVNLRFSQTYNYYPWQVVWSSDGYVDVTDKRPASREYYAEFTGKPDFKLVKLDESRMRDTERLVGSDFSAAKQQVDALRYEELTWDNF